MTIAIDHPFLDRIDPDSSLSYPLRFPTADCGHRQDLETCEVYHQGAWRHLRLHDYPAIYNMPGLYESLFYRTLKCNSPAVVVGLLADVLRDARAGMRKLRVLDLGAGNGMAGEELRRHAVARIIGADILPEAANAAQRDRPEIYDDYIVGDFDRLPPDSHERIRALRPNCLLSVAALGFGDIPISVFCRALNAVSPRAWIAFNVKEEFLAPAESTGFAALIHRLVDCGVLQIQAYRRYVHRLSISGKRLHYVAMVAWKKCHAPDHFLSA